MIQYADHELDEALPRMVRWNENGFAVPLFEDVSHANESPGMNRFYSISVITL